MDAPIPERFLNAWSNEAREPLHRRGSRASPIPGGATGPEFEPSAPALKRTWLYAYTDESGTRHFLLWKMTGSLIRSCAARTR
jgi:hypothetical protein